MEKQLNGAEAMVKMLEAHGVQHIFGLCGDTTLPFYDAMRALPHSITHVLTRDERSAAYMADGYSRVTGRVGVCEGPSGGGATYILPGLVEANESSYAVLGITTDISVGSYGKYPLTEVDQEALMRPLTKFNTVIKQAAHIPRMVRKAFRAATTGRPGAAHLGLPYDIQYDAVEASDIWADEALKTYPAYPCAPEQGTVEAALDAILSAKNPLIVCGGGVVIAGAMDALNQLATRLDIPVATSISGQGSLAETNAQCLGALGYAMAAALGAWFGRPERKVVAMMGDGSFGFTVGELETITRAKAPITYIVFSNASFGWIKASQMADKGARYYNVDFIRVDQAAVAAAYGVKSWRVEDPEQLESIMKQAISHNGPTLIDIITQPLEQANAPVRRWMG